MTCACLSMDTLLDYIERYHSLTPASVNASVFEDFERNFGRMPTDLKYLYSQCASLSLFNDKVVGRWIAVQILTSPWRCKVFLEESTTILKALQFGTSAWISLSYKLV